MRLEIEIKFFFFLLKLKQKSICWFSDLSKNVKTSDEHLLIENKTDKLIEHSRVRPQENFRVKNK